MPIYEFYCENCNTIYKFFSRTVNTSRVPSCPGCGRKELKRQISLFSTISGDKDGSEDGMPEIDESRLEKAMGYLASEAEKLDEDNPREAARLMRRLTEMTGITLGDRMEEAISRMEAGEDPDQIEAEMGDLLDDEEPFTVERRTLKSTRKQAPAVDDTLYEL